MEEEDKDFLTKYWSIFRNTCALLDVENPALQRPICEAEISLYIPDDFIDQLHTVGSVGGGPDVIDFEAQMYKGLFQLKWNICHRDNKIKENKIREYEIEYQMVPVSMNSEGPSSVICNGNAFRCYMNCLCPGYNYIFRIRSNMFSGWGRWTKPFRGCFDDFPCTISYIRNIIQIKVPVTGRYQITAKGAKAADGKCHKGGRGAIISAVFTLQKGDILDILCGGMSERQGCHSGGAGGTFVSVNTRKLESILVVAGGGGGTRGYDSKDTDGCDASLEPHGTTANATHCAEGGLDGAPGKDAMFTGPPWGFGGAGWKKSSTTACSFVEGGNGGECGGFGGGGGVGMYGGGEGGGFSGGGGGRVGGGGGSYVREDGDNVTKKVGNMHHGEVTIEKLEVSGNSSSNNSKEIKVLSPTTTSSSSSSKEIPVVSPSTTSVSSTSQQ